MCSKIKVNQLSWVFKTGKTTVMKLNNASMIKTKVLSLSHCYIVARTNVEQIQVNISNYQFIKPIACVILYFGGFDRYSNDYDIICRPNEKNESIKQKYTIPRQQLFPSKYFNSSSAKNSNIRFTNEEKAEFDNGIVYKNLIFIGGFLYF